MVRHNGPVSAQVIVLAGPSGAGKSRVAEHSGLPILRLDDFYKSGGDPTLPRITEGANAGERAELDQAPILIGRGSDAAIRLDDDYVSTRHARVASSGDEWFVEDLGSTNGTWVNQHRVGRRVELHRGDWLQIGETSFQLR